MNNVDHGAPRELWLRRLPHVYRIHKAELNALSDFNARYCRFVEINVVELCIDLYKSSTVQKN